MRFNPCEVRLKNGKLRKLTILEFWNCMSFPSLTKFSWIWPCVDQISLRVNFQQIAKVKFLIPLIYIRILMSLRLKSENDTFNVSITKNRLMRQRKSWIYLIEFPSQNSKNVDILSHRDAHKRWDIFSLILLSKHQKHCSSTNFSSQT